VLAAGAIAAFALTLGLNLLDDDSSLQPQALSPTPVVDKPAAKNSTPAEKLSFNRDIRPILSDKCFACHGPDAKVAKDAGGFRLDAREGATVPADASGKVPIVAGDANASEVVKRILSDNPKIQMPPPRSKMNLSAQEIGLIKRWIDEGAEYQGHWAYQTPTRPTPPTTQHESWVRNDIDRFIVARLEQAGLEPSPEADRATLIRRLSLDLIGLPPTPEQIDAFVIDKAPDAYERLVDRLLASEHFGERMAIPWLDASRYGDTNGFHHDNTRTAWPWRQWVINAFNSNMPYSQFVIEQLAGDLLPNATQEQILASGFCRMHNINDEGGALNEEYLVEATADRIETIATVFMAQTFTCSRCHDHKYDPITQDDYYSTWAYFNSVDQERGVYPNNGAAARAYPPFMLWRSDELQAKINALSPKLSDAKAQMDKFRPQLVKKFEDWQKAQRAKADVKWIHTDFKQATSSNKKTSVKIDEKEAVAELTGDVPKNEDLTLILLTEDTGLRLIKLDALLVSRGRGQNAKSLLGRGENGNAVLTGIELTATSIKDPAQSQKVTLEHAWASYEQPEGDFDILNALRDDKLGWAVGGHLEPGTRTAMFLASRPFGYEGGTELALTLRFQSQYEKHAFAKVKVDFAKANDNLRAAFPAPDAKGAERLKPLALIDKKLFTENTYDTFFVQWRASESPDGDQAFRQFESLEQEMASLEEQAVPVLVMKESSTPVPAYVLERGQYDKPITERVRERRPPMMFDLPMPEGAPDNRLGFAMWLTRPDHPLTSRVHVNRLWKMIFGAGLVKTVEDFGSQAQWPSNPALLDYLAVDFVETGWDQKAMLKKIVTSATYRQQAVTNPLSMEIDPDNRLLSHFPRIRLPGEFIRDQALYVSGLLNDQIGGPSVKPYQPGDLWNEVAITSSNTMFFKRDSGSDLYRRSMYTFWKKTSPPAQMATFNAPTREFCVVRRDVTNTPLQALTLWNDEQFLEAARALAQRTLSEPGSDDQRLSTIFRRCTGQPLNEKQLAILKETLEYYRQRYRQSPGNAAELLKQGEAPLPKEYDPAELASWMMVSSSVLSLDATIVRD